VQAALDTELIELAYLLCERIDLCGIENALCPGRRHAMDFGVVCLRADADRKRVVIVAPRTMGLFLVREVPTVLPDNLACAVAVLG